MEQKEVKSLPFRELVGSLMYLPVTSRTGIMFAVARLARFLANYGKAHCNEMNMVVFYLSSMRSTIIRYGVGDKDVIVYNDD